MTRRAPGSSRRRTCSAGPTTWRLRIPRHRSRAKTIDLEGLEPAPRAGLEPFERQVRVARTVQRLHAVADRLEHPFHLTVPSLVDRQLDSRAVHALPLGRRGLS